MSSRARLQSSALLLLGFSLATWAFRALYRGLIKPMPTATLYERYCCVQLVPSEQEKLYLEDYLRKDARFDKVYWEEDRALLPTGAAPMNTILEPTANPYVGPRTFSQEQRHLFFGRDREGARPAGAGPLRAAGALLRPVRRGQELADQHPADPGVAGGGLRRPAGGSRGRRAAGRRGRGRQRLSLQPDAQPGAVGGDSRPFRRPDAVRASWRA